MIIDGHAHACGDFLYPDKIIEELNKNGIDKIVLCPGELNSTKNYNLPDIGRAFPDNSSILYTLNFLIGVVSKVSGANKQLDEGNRYVYSLYKKCPSRILQAYWVNSFKGDFISKIGRDFSEYGFKMIKMHQCWSNYSVTDDHFATLCEWALSKELPIFIHLRSGKEGKRLIEFIKDHQEDIFIIGHLIGLEPFIEYAQYCKNVFFDISCPSLISEQKIERTIRVFGTEKIIFGSDGPYGKDNQEVNIKRIKNMNLLDSEKDMILGGNLKRIINL